MVRLRSHCPFQRSEAGDRLNWKRSTGGSVSFGAGEEKKYGHRQKFKHLN